MPAKRRCARCPTTVPAGTRLCSPCSQTHERERGSRHERGYGQQHVRERARWQTRIDAGEVIYCADGCGTRITGTIWDLGHTDDRSGYLGPMTQAHNRSDGGRRAHR